MLNLSILLTFLQGVTQVPVHLVTEQKDNEELACFFTRDMSVEPGSAGYLITDEFLFCGKVIRAPGEVLLLGPVSGTRLSGNDCQQILTRMGLRGPRAKSVRAQLNTLPQMPLSSFLQHLGLVNYILNEKTSLSLDNPTHRILPPPSAAVEPVFHNTKDLETYVIQCVEHGRTDLLEAFWETDDLQNKNMGDFSSDSVTSLKYVFFTATTLAVRAASRGGLDYDLAMTLSDSYFRKSQDIVSYESFQILWKQMLLDLTSRTAELQLGNSASGLVSKAARKINGMLNRRITVTLLAEDLGVTPDYLSHHFRRQTGRSLTDYIAHQKIGEAKRLMHTTQLSSAQIAYQLSFSSQSYFHAVFKKVTGQTPRQYRSAHCGVSAVSD